MAKVANRTVAVLATDSVKQVEPTEPVKALKAASIEVGILAPGGGQIPGIEHHEKAETPTVDHGLAPSRPNRSMRGCCPDVARGRQTIRSCRPWR